MKTWPKNNKDSVLFLGEWCRRFSQKEIWEDMSASVLEYHWDNREKLFSDYKYLQEVNESLLISLSKKLNAIHSVDYSLRYWRILIGPWLAMFVQILFDRWTTINDALKNPNVKKCIIFDHDPLFGVPNGMEDFSKLLGEDNWNEFIYAQILQNYFSERINLVKISPSRKTKTLNSQ
ncbi:hypothetical protein OAI80_00845, partial [Paracoccaceae bacterium]|nr:hypothetical protein [Paracoccaceae bacterium]